MNSIVYYLYEYKNNQKSRNVGFLKFSQETDFHIFQIRARGLSVFQNDSAALSVLFSSNDAFFAHPIESVLCENHAITCRLEIPLQNLSLQTLPGQRIGFLLELPGGSYIAGVDTGINFHPSLIAPLTADSVPDTKPDADPVPDEQIEQKELSVQKLSRNGLSVLPRSYWYLANNSFLLHGYYNYNHLLLVEEDGHFLLGVPGIYDKQEARAAELFGFPSFSDSYKDQIKLSPQDSQIYNTFGHWFRKIPKEK